MAHRGPLREIFRMICVAVLFSESERRPTPSLNTIIYDSNNVVNMHHPQNVPLSPPPTSSSSPHIPTFNSVLSTILACLLTILAYLATQFFDQATTIAAEFIWNSRLLPFIRRSSAIFTRAHRYLRGLGVRRRVTNVAANPKTLTVTTPSEGDMVDESSRSTPTHEGRAAVDRILDSALIDESSRPTPSNVTTILSDEDGEWSDIEEPDVEESPSPLSEPPSDSTPEPPNIEEVLATLRADSENKDQQITDLTNTVDEQREKMATRNNEFDRLMTTMREALDPKNSYAVDTDIVDLAQLISKEYNRISKNISQEKTTARQAEGQVQVKDREVLQLTLDIQRLNTRVQGLEVSQESSVVHQQEMERQTEERIKEFKERAVEAEARANQGPTQIAYDSLRRNYDMVVEDLNKARGQSADEQGTETSIERITTLEEEARSKNEEVESAKARTQEAEATAEEAKTNARDAATRAEVAETNARDAATRAEVAKTNAQDAEARKQDAEAKAEETEKKARAAEEKAATVQQELQRAEDLVKENSDLQVRLTDASGKEAAAFESGYLKALADNPPASNDLPHEQQDAGVQTETAGSENDSSYQRGCQDTLTRYEAEMQRLLEDEKRHAQERLDTAVAEGQQAVREAAEASWVLRRGEQQASEAANLARQKEELRTSAEAAWARRETELIAQHGANAGAPASEREEVLRTELDNAKQLLELADDDLIQFQDAYTKLEKEKADEKDRANEAEAKLKKAEAEVEKLQKRQDSLAAALKNADLKDAELVAARHDRERAEAMMQEFMNRPFSFDTAGVLNDLNRANAMIARFQAILQSPHTKSNQKEFLHALHNAEVRSVVNKEHNHVLFEQCRGANAKLRILREIINFNTEPDKQELLEEIFAPRGDEDARWGGADLAQPPSSDEDEDDDPPRPLEPSERRRLPLPKPRRAQPAPPSQASVAPLPSDRRLNNELKRKNHTDDTDADGRDKRANVSELDMRPVAEPSFQLHQQGSSSSEIADGQMEAKTESQGESSSSVRFGEASGPQQQSSHEVDMSPPLPYIPPLFSQHSTSQNPVASSEPPSHVEHAAPLKATKTTSRQSKPHWKASERQERLRFKNYPESEAAPSEEAATSAIKEGPTAFSFNMAKDKATVMPNPTPAQPDHKPIFTGLSLLGAAMADKSSMADKKAALPGLPAPEADEVIDFGSSIVSEDRDSDRELYDRFLTNDASDGEDDEETAWEDALYPPEPDDDDLEIPLRPHASTTDTHWLDDLDDPTSPVRDLDMTEQNYEEQAAEAAAAARRGPTPHVPQSRPSGENRVVLEDNFHIDLD